jgi:hypothetical protein
MATEPPCLLPVLKSRHPRHSACWPAPELSNTAFWAISPSTCAGQLLHTLDLSNDCLTRLPRVLASATALTSLLLGGNSGLSIPREDVDGILAAMTALASLTVHRGVLGPDAAERLLDLLPGLAIVEEAAEEEAGLQLYRPPRSEASSSSDEEEEL